MSWQAYVDDSLIGTGNLDQAAIFGHQGGEWATSANFKVNPTEFAEIQKAFEDPFNAQLQANGFVVGGIKYLCVKSDDRSLYGMKLKTGIIIVKSKQAFIIAHYPDGVLAQTAATVTEKLADYLIGLGY